MTGTKPLKITHVVTYASQDGAFGGPLAVAIEQTQALAALGHDVELVMGWDGKVEVNVPGVEVRLFPVRRVPRTGFSGYFSPALQHHLRATLRRRDVVHVHLGRDLVTAPVARRARRSSSAVFVQTHGMVAPDRRLRAAVFDRLFIRQALAGATRVLALTPEEEVGVAEVARGRARIERITNGVTVPQLLPKPSGDGSRIEVLFLARLHPRKRVLVFAEAAALVAESLPDVQFAVVGPDEGDLDELRAFISERHLEDRVRYEGSVSPGAAPARIAQATVYVLPSVGEVVPMSVLEALAVGTPTFITESNGLAGVLREHNAAVVVDENPTALALALCDVLVSEPRRRELAAAGRRIVDAQFSSAAVARNLEHLYVFPR